MRELATREYTPPLAYAAALLFLVEFLVTATSRQVAVAAGIHVVFLVVVALLVMRVDAPPWARLAGYGWCALGLLGDLVLLGAAIMGSAPEAGWMLATIGLLPGAAWVTGASLFDAGPGRALGIAAAVGMAFSALVALSGAVILTDGGLIVRIVSQMTLGLLIAWFAVLGRDLSAGKRHWGGAPSL